jgi:hypothetical protein
MFQLDSGIQIFELLCRHRVPLSLSVYNAVLDACACTTVLWNPSTPLADLNANALASLTGTGMCPISLKSHHSTPNVSGCGSAVPFSRANWGEAIRLIRMAIVDGVVPHDVVAPPDMQSKDSASVVLDASAMGVGQAQRAAV